MAGSPLEVFTDFVNSTGPAILTGPEQIVNDVTRQTWTISRFMRGKSMNEMIQGGETIRDNIYLDLDSTFANYKPNAEFSYRNPQILTQWSIPWRFSKADTAFTDQEVGINSGELSKGARHHKYKTLKHSIEQNLYTGLLEGLDDQLWARPDTAEMETTTGEKPYTIPAFINEEVNGLAAANVDVGGTAWTTIQGINPVTKTNWKAFTSAYNMLGDYSNRSSHTAAATATHLFEALSAAYYRTRFEQLPFRPDLSETVSSQAFIGASQEGIVNYELSLRSNQDTFVTTGRQDPAYNMPKFRGIDMVYLSPLDTALLYDSGAAAVNEADATRAGGPRYYGVNSNYVCKCIHRNRYFYRKPAFSPSKQPFTKIVIVDMWHNNVFRSLRRHFLVTPYGANADVGVGAEGLAGNLPEIV